MGIENNINNYILTKEAAQKLGVSRQAIHKKIKAGQLDHVKKGPIVLIKKNNKFDDVLEEKMSADKIKDK